MTTKTEPKPVLITIEIDVIKSGKRKITVSGAPEKEMPIVRAGLFVEVHRLFDEVWIELQKREPQVVTVKAEKAKAKSSPANDKPKGAAADEGTADEGEASIQPMESEAAVPVQAVPVAGSEARPAPPALADLPPIEGDTTVDNAGEKAETSTITEGADD